MSLNATVEHYLCSDIGLMMPFVNESTWSKGGRAFIYLVGMLWTFMGVAIVADVFMCGIEKITSYTRVVKVQSDNEQGYREIHVRLWNDTVANLTLLALGTSAPEILLAIIEICGKGFHSGKLGPSTIVGAAAFNLLCITGVCILAIPSPEKRSIKAIKVFIVTAFSSIFAYVWLVIILVIVTPDIVDLWEACFTFLYFPILVILAYFADRDFCATKIGENPEQIQNDRIKEVIQELKRSYPDLTDLEIAQLAAARAIDDQPRNILWYRINATRSLAGGPKIQPQFSTRLNQVYEHLQEEKSDDREKLTTIEDPTQGGTRCVVEFTTSQSAILENKGPCKITVHRYGNTNNLVTVELETLDGTAEAGKDYTAIQQVLVFQPGDSEKTVDIEIIDDNEWEPDEIFFLKLSLPKSTNSDNVILGNKTIHEIKIINDDEPGIFEFVKPSYLVKESKGQVVIPVERRNGADGQVEVEWRTGDMTAVSGQDYDGGKGVLTFGHGEISKCIEITILENKQNKKDEAFSVELVSVTEGAELGRIKRTVVTIVHDDDSGMLSRLVDLTNLNVDSMSVDTSSWSEQFRSAMNVNGGDLENATTGDYVMHFLTFGWKVIFAFIPPTSILGGWPTFGCALAMIGVLTAIIGDLASIFGCLVGLEDSITAITFVALGTSLSDLFASKQAAVQEKTADGSVGHITGSNSVNVFLGLGLPWLMASIYWTSKGDTFKVKAGTLTFSVVIYTIAAAVAVTLLMARRYVPSLGGELGGPFGPKVISAVILFVLWFLYVLLSSLEAYGHITVSF